MERDIEYWKDLARKRGRTICDQDGKISELESEMEDMTDFIDEHRSDASFWRDMAESYEERWQDKTELLKRIGELS